MSLPVLIRTAGGNRQRQFSSRERAGGLDQRQVRTWHSLHRHTVLSMCAQALLAIAATHRPSPHRGRRHRRPARSLARTPGKLPASAGDQPPGDEPGLVKVSVPEAPHGLARLATAPMAGAARQLGYAWSRWRRRHQARARWHHYHAQLTAAPRPPEPGPTERRPAM